MTFNGWNLDPAWGLSVFQMKNNWSSWIKPWIKRFRGHLSGLVKCLSSAQAMISGLWFWAPHWALCYRPRACFSPSVSLSLCPSPARALSLLSLSKHPEKRFMIPFIKNIHLAKFWNLQYFSQYIFTSCHEKEKKINTNPWKRPRMTQGLENNICIRIYSLSLFF